MIDVVASGWVSGCNLLRIQFRMLLLFFLPAAAGVVGAPLNRTTADGAIPGALPGYGVSDNLGMHGRRRKRAQRYHEIDCGEELRYHGMRNSSHNVFPG